jgi:hypothetical protein
MICEACKTRPAAFLVKHPETSRHWACLRCFRDHARDAPVVVVGVASSSGAVEHAVQLPKLAAAAWLLQDVWRSARTAWRVVYHPSAEAPPVTESGVRLAPALRVEELAPVRFKPWREST